MANWSWYKKATGRTWGPALPSMSPFVRPEATRKRCGSEECDSGPTTMSQTKSSRLRSQSEMSWIEGVSHLLFSFLSHARRFQGVYDTLDKNSLMVSYRRKHSAFFFFFAPYLRPNRFSGGDLHIGAGYRLARRLTSLFHFWELIMVSPRTPHFLLAKVCFNKCRPVRAWNPSAKVWFDKYRSQWTPQMLASLRRKSDYYLTNATIDLQYSLP